MRHHAPPSRALHCPKGQYPECSFISPRSVPSGRRVDVTRRKKRKSKRGRIHSKTTRRLDSSSRLVVPRRHRARTPSGSRNFSRWPLLSSLLWSSLRSPGARTKSRTAVAPSSSWRGTCGSSSRCRRRSKSSSERFPARRESNFLQHPLLDQSPIGGPLHFSHSARPFPPLRPASLLCCRAL